MPFSLPFTTNGTDNSQCIWMSYLWVTIFYCDSACANDTTAETS